MRIVLDIKENKGAFFLELIKSLNFVDIVRASNDNVLSSGEKDLLNALNDVKLHESGKKKLKTAEEFLNEL